MPEPRKTLIKLQRAHGAKKSARQIRIVGAAPIPSVLRSRPRSRLAGPDTAAEVTAPAHASKMMNLPRPHLALRLGCQRLFLSFSLDNRRYLWRTPIKTKKNGCSIVKRIAAPRRRSRCLRSASRLDHWMGPLVVRPAPPARDGQAGVRTMGRTAASIHSRVARKHYVPTRRCCRQRLGVWAYQLQIFSSGNRKRTTVVIMRMQRKKTHVLLACPRQSARQASHPLCPCNLKYPWRFDDKCHTDCGRTRCNRLASLLPQPGNAAVVVSSTRFFGI